MKSEALHTTWVEQVPDEQWAVYQRLIAAVQAQRLPFALGGAFALAAYSTMAEQGSICSVCGFLSREHHQPRKVTMNR
jgi:hypothetical protein